MKKLVIIVAIILTPVIGLSAINYYAAKPTVQAQVQPPTRSELLRLVNIERKKVGVSPLVEDTRLDQSAQLKADDMFNNSYFGHVDRNGKHGYEYIFETAPKVCKYVSENITDNVVDQDNTSSQAVYNWVNSPPHYKAMTDVRYDSTGFGISGTKITQHFCDIQ